MLAMFLGTDGGVDALGSEYVPKLFDGISLMYEYNFDDEGKHDQAAEWDLRQHTNWNVKNGILTGGLGILPIRK